MTERGRCADKVWKSEALGTVNGSPVFHRTMENCMAEFHAHEENDEMFVVLSGTLYIDTEDHSYRVAAGDVHNVKAGTIHRARAECRVEVIVIGGQNA
ncbi:MAG: cupin domain-containing protein [Pseudomonadota bacterium]